ncbi:cytochrome P450 [Collybia nuda]|uniref:Cytochrome P450 n=1 Tax=Collybia nuda TaxID=64659 RepID=A0A9P5XTI4_9AGAR|nr:cytochrome P450 [Collybia nuda]
MSIPVVLIASSVILLLLVRWNSRKPKVPFPPGPPALPVLGHIMAIPAVDQGEFFSELAKTYGDIIHLHIPMRSYIVLNSVEASIELLEKRSHNYSDRPVLPLMELMGFFPTLSILGYGPRFRLHRRMVQQYFKRQDIAAYRPIQIRGSRVLLQNLMSAPDKRNDHLSQYASSILMRITFGYDLTSGDDKYLSVVKAASHVLETPGLLAGTIVDFFPILQHLPSWFPGGYYPGVARRARVIIQQMHDFPYHYVQEQMAKGQAKPSFMATNLEALNNQSGIPSNTIMDIKGAVGTVYVGGAETTWGTLSMFFLTMMLYPECQAKAQAEIDTVVGSGRLPDFDDRESLPYIECVLQETLRWNNVLPLGVPHCSLEDDIYNGMFIPKGSIVIANTRGMALNENTYSDPHTFNPSRYLSKPIGKGEPYPIAHFGFGRRVCPGRYFAEDSLWITIVSILATLHISKALDESGKEITPELKFTSGVSRHPAPFQCKIEPRNKAAQTLIEGADTTDYY